MEDTYTKGSVKWDVTQAILEGEKNNTKSFQMKKNVDEFSYLPFPTINPEAI